MPAPLVVPIAVAVARAIAAQAAKQGVKKLAQSEARKVARKVIAQKGGPKAVSGKTLDRAINIANQSSRSGRPTPNTGGGLRTTYSGPPKGKISKVAATRAAEKAAGPRARREGGNAALRVTKPKPTARITRKISGEVVRMGPGKKIDVKLTQRAEGPARPVKVKKTVTQGRIVKDIKSTDFVRPADRTRIVSIERKPFLTKEKVTVSRGVKRTTNKSGSAITVRKVEPRKAAEVRAERAKAKRAKLREALTPRVNPARPKTQPKRGKSERDERTAIERDEPQGITIRGKFYSDGNRGLMPRGKQPTIESRIGSRVEKPTRGSVPSKYDKEAGARADEAIKVSTRLKAKVKPGKPTKTTVALRTVGGSKATKAARNAELKGIIRNQRRVLKERELKEAGEKIRKAEEAAKIREAAAKRSGKGLLKGRVIK
jgi:hypothetical protein